MAACMGWLCRAVSSCCCCAGASYHEVVRPRAIGLPGPSSRSAPEKQLLQPLRPSRTGKETAWGCSRSWQENFHPEPPSPCLGMARWVMAAGRSSSSALRLYL
jgi:hypothetical protein